jgi:hypothetical protein
MSVIVDDEVCRFERRVLHKSTLHNLNNEVHPNTYIFDLPFDCDTESIAVPTTQAHILGMIILIIVCYYS